MSAATIDGLLREQQAIVLQERRSSNRQPFVRPVLVKRNRKQDLQAFSRDISHKGICLIVNEDLKAKVVCDLEIHSIGSTPAYMRAELRWSNRFGKGWFVTGWQFL